MSENKEDENLNSQALCEVKEKTKSKIFLFH